MVRNTLVSGKYTKEELRSIIENLKARKPETSTKYISYLKNNNIALRKLVGKAMQELIVKIEEQLKTFPRNSWFKKATKTINLEQIQKNLKIINNNGETHTYANIMEKYKTHVTVNMPKSRNAASKMRVKKILENRVKAIEENQSSIEDFISKELGINKQELKSVSFTYKSLSVTDEDLKKWHTFTLDNPNPEKYASIMWYYKIQGQIKIIAEMMIFWEESKKRKERMIENQRREKSFAGFSNWRRRHNAEQLAERRRRGVPGLPGRLQK